MINKKKKDKTPTWSKKNFPAILANFFFENCPQLGGELTVKPIVDQIVRLIDLCMPPTDRMRMGQMLWYPVSAEETSGYGKPLEKCQLVPVTLDYIHQQDIDNMLAGMKKKQRQIHTVVRLFNQTYEQGGVMTNADVGAIMRLSPSTISKYVREYEREHEVAVPRRGNIHDMGPTLTHKRIICIKHFHEGKSIEQTARETHHSPAAVARYAHDFKRVRECLKEQWPLEKISYATGLSKGLTQQYVDLIENEKFDDNSFSAPDLSQLKNEKGDEELPF